MPSDHPTWSSTPRELRHRKPLCITLSDDERKLAEGIAVDHQVAMSRVVGAGLRQLDKLSGRALADAIDKAGDDEESRSSRKTTTTRKRKK